MQKTCVVPYYEIAHLPSMTKHELGLRCPFQDVIEKRAPVFRTHPHNLPGRRPDQQ